MEVKDRDRRFLSALKKVYEAVSNAPASIASREVRKICNQSISEAFALTDTQIKGSEYLPYEKNTIFIYNHLSNHPFYTEDEGFQITLDSHFISSQILDKYYGDSGMRVVRHSLPEEENHRAYYERLDYIRVYAKKFIPEGLNKNDIKWVNKEFYPKAISHLNKNAALVFSPEGNSYPTGDSPGIFRHGIFKLACKMNPQPLIVPLVMANFDRLASEVTFKCEIKPPFRMKDMGITDKDDPRLDDVVKTLNRKYKTWIGELQNEKQDFEHEISQLEKKVNDKNQEEHLDVFYGSSTIRLWKSLQTDFPNSNILNLGFGGAFIDSLSQNFERLFRIKTPKSIVLYLGGNDLSLGWTAERIVDNIKSLILKIHQKFPNTTLVNISIKPSLERAQQMEDIVRINRLMKEYAKKLPFLNQVDFFELLLDKGQANPNFFLQDGLHLNSNGYKLLKNQLINYL
ncbi:MAG: GDSL-type esterase/lipase family protein [Flavobacteriaceae bacterium]|jgi:lysophospholipase L1-like esterase